MAKSVSNTNDATIEVVMRVNGTNLTKHSMERLVPDAPLRDEGITGIVNAGRNGRYIGYAVKNEQGEYMFNPVRHFANDNKVKK